MQTIFILTHLTMVGAVSPVLYIVLGIEHDEATPPNWSSHFFNRFRAFGYSLKTLAFPVSAYVARFKVSNRLIRKAGHTI
jgi:hypothetical protein